MISFLGKQYEVRTINLPMFGNVLISTTALNSKLLNDNGNYATKEARWIDEKIFYFVEDSEMELSDEYLSAVIICQTI